MSIELKLVKVRWAGMHGWIELKYSLMYGGQSCCEEMVYKGGSKGGAGSANAPCFSTLQLPAPPTLLSAILYGSAPVIHGSGPLHSYILILISVIF